MSGPKFLNIIYTFNLSPEGVHYIQRVEIFMKTKGEEPGPSLIMLSKQLKAFAGKKWQDIEIKV